MTHLRSVRQMTHCMTSAEWALAQAARACAAAAQAEVRTGLHHDTLALGQADDALHGILGALPSLGGRLARGLVVRRRTGQRRRSFALQPMERLLGARPGAGADG